jgi:hypothetical protein
MIVPLVRYRTDGEREVVQSIIESRGALQVMLGRHRRVDRQAHYVYGSRYRHVTANHDHKLSQLARQVCALSHECPIRRVALGMRCRKESDE